ncbi:juvenile hormone esterase-like [Leptopilina boulardi]|uniref:juvenile hormone esterase-like n=1 Tax=Leptopilina boulardi TaxID=63433 RepID=UPI0021F5CEF6|nr:juvenile hormone esterase-like [Leptopilina boulardi]
MKIKMRQDLFNFLYLVIFWNFYTVLAQENLIVNLNGLGSIKGSLMTTRLGKKIYSFRGVRYAEPPIGKLRFQPPVPVKPWDQVFDASKEGPACPQLNYTIMSEDCLRLNVYTTKLPSANEKVNRPVIIFIHPGGFYSYSGQSDQFGPEYLLDRDVVLVTINYRLGSLGFLSAAHPRLLGNMGLKDQVIALRWVKKNIQVFGGDSNSVTITGYSAGSGSVTMHLVSPMSRGLFHRAIAMSGSVTGQRLLGTNQKDMAIKQAKYFNCSTNSVDEIVDCLQTIPAQDIANSMHIFYEWYHDPVVKWIPIVEPEVDGVERFLIEEPINSIREGRVAPVPVIGGVNKDEFSAVIVYPIELCRKGNCFFLDQWNSNWNHIAPISFQYERNTSRTECISKELKKFYINNHVTLENIEGIGQLYSDAIIIFSEHRFINLLSAVSKYPVYYYHFTYQGRYSHIVWTDTKKPFGVSHHDELMYVFYMSRFPKFVKGDPEISMVEKMTAIFENFAKTGKPIPNHNSLFENVKWKKFTTLRKRYLEINNCSMIMKNGVIYPKRMKLWDSLFPLLTNK